MAAPDTSSTPDSSAAMTEPTVSKEELNSWKVGFTPQAEIWNGRLAMLGLTLGLVSVVVTNLLR